MQKINNEPTPNINTTLIPGVVEKMVEGEVGERCRAGGEVGEPDFKPSDLIRLSILNAVHFSD